MKFMYNEKFVNENSETCEKILNTMPKSEIISIIENTIESEISKQLHDENILKDFLAYNPLPSLSEDNIKCFFIVNLNLIEKIWANILEKYLIDSSQVPLFQNIHFIIDNYIDDIDFNYYIQSLSKVA